MICRIRCAGKYLEMLHFKALSASRRIKNMIQLHRLPQYGILLQNIQISLFDARRCAGDVHGLRDPSIQSVRAYARKGEDIMPFQIRFADILSIRCDAIVNPTDELLSGSGGLDAKIRAAAGHDLTLACRRAGQISVGGAIITPGFQLNNCRYIIHTASPWWSNRQEDVQGLRQCYRSALRLAEKFGLESAAFPLIGSGTRGFPKELVLRAAVEEIGQYLKSHDMSICLVIHNRSEFRPDPALIAGLERYIDSVRTREEAAGRKRGEPMPDAAAQTLPRESRQYGAREPEAKPRRREFPLSNLSPFKRREREEDRERREDKNISDVAPCAPAPVFMESEEEARGPSFEAPGALPYPDADAAFEEHAALQASRARRIETPTFTGSFAPDRGAILDESFSQMVLRLIDEKGFKKDSECYSRANIDRRLFSKIRSDESYHPKKTTALALAVALELSLGETGELLMKAGYSLSHSILFDVIVEYCILQKNYNIYEINELLFQYDQPLLGA